MAPTTDEFDIDHSHRDVSPSMATSGPRPTIFVSIPSYRDPECQYTIVDLFRKARYPERVYVGVCWQVDRDADGRCFLLDLSEFRMRIRELFVHHSEARGPCVARARIERELFGGEDFFLQLDSHYRMAEHWDEDLLTQLALCPSERAILTTYPSSYTLPDDYEPGGADMAHVRMGDEPVLLCAREFDQADGFLRITGKLCHPIAFDGVPHRSYFYAAGFVFSSSVAHQMVPYDPHLEDLFFGEECGMAVRLWSSGWDFFAPTKVFGYHLWTRKHRSTFREHACPGQRRRESISQLRIRSLLGQLTDEDAISVDLGIYGLGTVRSLTEYQELSGVNFISRHISKKGLQGGLEPTAFISSDSAQISTSAVTPSSAPSTQVTDSSLPAMLALMPSKVVGDIHALLGVLAVPVATATQENPPRLQLLRRLRHLRLLQPVDVDTFNRCGLVIIDGFLAKRAYGKVCGKHAVNSPSIARNGALGVPLRSAGLGRGEKIWNNSIVRGDEMSWLSMPQGEGLLERATSRVNGSEEFLASGRSESTSSQSMRTLETQDQSVSVNCDEDSEPRFYGDLDVCLAQLSVLREDFNSLLEPPPTRMSTMLACYRGEGARYARHRDALPEHGEVGKRRRLTVIYYMNPDWKPSDGGCLRVYLPPLLETEVEGARRLMEDGSNNGEWYRDVEPVIDRLVIFPSDLEHEVLPANAERYAITTWFY